MATFCSRDRGRIGVAEKVPSLEPENLLFTHLAFGQLVCFLENQFPHQKMRIILNFQNSVATEIKIKNVFN